VILYAIHRGAKRFNQIWADRDVRDLVHSRTTLSRYLDGLEKEGVVVCKRLSRKNVFYEIAPGEKSSWILAAGGTDVHLPISMVQAILKVGDKAKALDIALNYAFTFFFEQEIRDAAARIMAGNPQFREFFLEGMKGGHRIVNEDWSDDMISFRSRRYYMFLRNLRTILDKYPEHVIAYLTRKPWLACPKDEKKEPDSEDLQGKVTHHDLQTVQQILQHKYPKETLGLQLEIEEAIRRQPRALLKEFVAELDRQIKPQ